MLWFGLILQSVAAAPLVLYQGPMVSAPRAQRMARRLEAPEQAALIQLGALPSLPARRRILRTLGEEGARFAPAMVAFQEGRVRAAEQAQPGRTGHPCNDQVSRLHAIGFVDTPAERPALLAALIAASQCHQALTGSPADDPYAPRAWEMARQEPALYPTIADQLPPLRADLPRPQLTPPPWISVSVDGYPLTTDRIHWSGADVTWTVTDSSGTMIPGASLHVSLSGGGRWDLITAPLRDVSSELAALDEGAAAPRLIAWLQLYPGLPTEEPTYLVDHRFGKRPRIWRWDAASGTLQGG